MIEPEFITIIEGPTPEFRPSSELSLYTILEGPEDSLTLFCEMRTMNGADIRDRCRTAWQEGRPVRLDFPDEMRMRQQLDVVSLRLEEADEGTVLPVWVRQPMSEIVEEIEDDDDYDDPFDDDDDDLVF